MYSAKKNRKGYCLSKNGIRANAYQINGNEQEPNMGEFNQNIDGDIDLEGQDIANQDE